MKSLLFAIATLILTIAGMQFGSRWHGVAVPTRNVELVATDGVHYPGDLTRTWSGEYVVTAADGSHVIFKDFRALIIKGSAEQSAPSLFISAWRVFFVPIALIVVWMGFSTVKVFTPTEATP